MAGVSCELRCADSGLLERAAGVLRGSAASELAPGNGAALVWEVTPASRFPTGPGWRIRRVDTGESWQRASAEAALRCVEFGSILAVVEGPFGITTLHGALLDRRQLGLLILGPCESGKSTLAAALWGRGWTLLGDDVAVAEADGRARPLPRRVSLRHGSRSLLGETLWSRVLASASCSATEDGYLFHPSELDPAPHPAVTSIAGIVFLARRGTDLGPAEVRHVNPAQALLSLAPYSNVIRRAGLPEALETLQPLAASAPAFDLGRGPLPDMIEAIDRHVLAG